MVKRRKMMIGMGALAAGSVAGIGTGAFTSASIPDRQVSVTVERDDEATIALVPGNDPDVSISTNPGELQLDLSGQNGEGVNINSVYTWGDPTDPSNDYAFKIVNNDELTYGGPTVADPAVTLTYDVADANDDWVQFYSAPAKASQIIFSLYTAGGALRGRLAAPDFQVFGPGNQDPHSAGTHSWHFNPGDSWYVVVTVDTTGSEAATSDDLTGTLTLDVGNPRYDL